MSSNDWQLDKSIEETNLYMLEHKLYCDLTFKVGGAQLGSCSVTDVSLCSAGRQKTRSSISNFSAIEDFKAHRFMLISRSPVFAAMILSDTIDTTQPFISIPDVTPEAFNNTLIFMYTSKCTLTPENVLATLYSSRKYIIPDLTARCLSYLEANLNADNACLIHDQCLLYGFDMEHKCRRFIEMKTDEVIASTAFVNLPETAVTNLVKLDKLSVSESSLFQAIYRWGEEECRRKRGDVVGVEKAGVGVKKVCCEGKSSVGKKEVDVEGVRGSLGNILPHMRFPCMSVKEFLSVSKTGLLSTHERCQIFEFLLSEKDSRASIHLPYPLTPRFKPGVIHFKRFTQFAKSNIYTGDCSMMKMSCNKSIVLLGFGISASCEFDPVLDIQLSIKHERRFLFNKSIPANDNQRSPTLHIKLGSEVHLQADLTYSIIITFQFVGDNEQGICKRGKGGSKSTVVEGHTFDFDRSDSGSLISEVWFSPHESND